MALKKQSIRKNMHITENGKPVSKDVLIIRSENWNEIQENLFIFQIVTFSFQGQIHIF